MSSNTKEKYGCWVELNCSEHEGPFPDCVIDQDRREDCIHANSGMEKKDCQYWRVNDYIYTEEENT